MHLHSSLFNEVFYLLVVSLNFAILAGKTLSVDLKFHACIPQNCENCPNISYPFWIVNQQKPYFGHPNFEVTCNGENPVLAISDDDYIIKDLFYANNSFLLAASLVYDFDNTCPIPLHNFSIEGTPFDYSLGYADLFFFYDCTPYPVVCASNATHDSFAVFHKETFEHENCSIESCHTSVNAPVEGEDFGKLLEMNFSDVLRKGFLFCNGAKLIVATAREVAGTVVLLMMNSSAFGQIAPIPRPL